MRLLVIFLVLTAALAGCGKRSPQPPVQAQPPAADGPTHISETNRLRLGMHESEVFQILGWPSRRESGFNNGYRLWFELYDPRLGTLPTNYLISTDKNGFVTFLSSSGASSNCCPCP